MSLFPKNTLKDDFFNITEKDGIRLKMIKLAF